MGSKESHLSKKKNVGIYPIHIRYIAKKVHFTTLLLESYSNKRASLSFLSDKLCNFITIYYSYSKNLYI